MYMYKENALHKELKISPFISPATSVWESCFRNRKVGVMDTKNAQHTHSPTQVLLNQRMHACLPVPAILSEQENKKENTECFGAAALGNLRSPLSPTAVLC